MLYYKKETRELLIAPPQKLDGTALAGFIEVPDNFELPPLPEPPPQPDLESFNEKQIDTLTKVFVEGNKTQPIRIGQLQNAWNSGNFEKAIRLWNYLAPSFVGVVTAQEIASFQADLITYNIPIFINSTTLELSLIP